MFDLSQFYLYFNDTIIANAGRFLKAKRLGNCKKWSHTKLLRYENIKWLKRERFDYKNWRESNQLKTFRGPFSKSLKCIFTTFLRQALAGPSWLPVWLQSPSAGPAFSHRAPASARPSLMTSMKGLLNLYPSHSRCPKIGTLC